MMTPKIRSLLCFISLFVLSITIGYSQDVPGYEFQTLTRLNQELGLSMNDAQARVEILKQFYKKQPPLNSPNYDETTNEFVFDTLIHLPGLSKDRIIQRSKEFIAIQYGNINAVLHYEDPTYGRMICKGAVRVSAARDYSSAWSLFFPDGSEYFSYINLAWFTTELYFDNDYLRVVISNVAFDEGRQLPLLAFFPMAMNARLGEMKGAYAIVKNTDQKITGHLEDWAVYLEQTLEADKWHE